MPITRKFNLYAATIVGGVFIIGAASAAFAASAALTSVYPTPGLYRIDTQGDLKQQRGNMPAITQQYTQEGAGGSAQIKGARAGSAPVTTNVPGQAPANVCIKPLPAIGTMPVATNCKSSAPVVGLGSLSYTSVCGGMKLNTAIKKIDDKTWEYRIVTSGNPAMMTGQQDFSGMRAMLAAQAKNAATPKERADAAATLSQMGAYEAEMKKNTADLAAARAEMAAEEGGGAASVGPAGAGGYSTERTVVQRLTKISATCGAVTAR